jgi:hypothetical protein
MDVPPVIVENFPEVQLVQAEKPVLVAYEKVRQSWHALCPVTPANFPRGQDVQTVLGTLENVPVPQEMHEELPCSPVPVEYVPAPQATHTEVPVIEEYVPPEQGAQALAPTEDVNVPAVHWAHVETPVVLANVPARHGMHTPLKEAPTVAE